MTERVPEAAVVNGVPQGLFVGRVARSIPAGGLEDFDWARHRAGHSGDSGTWESLGGQLRVVWGDGGVNQGPLTVHPNAIEFYGKRYARMASIGVAALVGRWQSTRGTAIAGGVVSGGAVAGSEVTMAGKLAIAGATATFHGDDGTLVSYTFLVVPGTPVAAFSLDADMFTR